MCILTVTDKVSRWVEAYPLPNMTAAQVADVLLTKFVTQYGCPIKISSDRGSNFTSELIQDVLKHMNVQQQFSPAYCPWVNGSVERMNGTIIRMLRHYVNDNMDDWDDKLPFVLFAYRSTKNTMTGYTPFEMVYGSNARMPSEASLQASSSPSVTDSSSESAAYLDRLTKTLQEAWTHARANDETYRQPSSATSSSSPSLPPSASSKPSSSSSEHHRYHIGDYVWIRQPSHTAKSGKFAEDWSGPWAVKKILSDVRITVQRGSGQGRWDIREAHVTNVKRYHGKVTTAEPPLQPASHRPTKPD